MNRNKHPSRRWAFALGTLAVLGAGSAAARIDLIEYWNKGASSKLCNPMSLRAEYANFIDGSRVRIARGGKVEVRLIGDGADFATDLSESISGVTVRFSGRGTVNRPGAGPMFGSIPQIGYVDTTIEVGNNAELGIANVRVHWVGGSERIPIRVYESCPTSSAGSGGSNAGSGSGSGSVRVTPPIIGGGGGGTTNPDLVPQFAPLGLLRHEAAGSRRISQSFCQGLPSPSVPSQAAVGEIRVGDIRWGVVNSSNQGTAAAFEARFSVGDAPALDTRTIAGMSGGQSQLFTFIRPESRTKVIRIDATTSLNVRNQYGGIGCFQFIMAAGDPLNWQDPRFTVRVDALNAVAEGNGGETNNVLTF